MQQTLDNPSITAIRREASVFPEKKPHKNFLLTSALGGVAALLMEGLLHPIDTIRTRIKSKTKVYAPFFQYAKRMYRREGMKSYFGGFSATLYGSFVSNASYFYVYERCKYELENSKLVPKDTAPFIAGFVGGFMSDFLKLPFDVIRTRMQLKPGHYDYRDCLDGARKIVKYEGVKALYLGAPAFFTLSASTTSLTFGLYEIFYRIFKPIFPKGEGANLPLATLSSACAGSLAAIITNPLDVIVTRIESIDTTSKKGYGTIEIAKSIYKKEGLAGFMKGVTGTIVYYMMSAVILFPTYEVLRVLFNVNLSE